MTSVTKAVILLFLLSGCATLEKPSVVISDYCGNAGVIRPSRADTPGTLRQIAKNNAKYRALCSGDVNASNASR